MKESFRDDDLYLILAGIIDDALADRLFRTFAQAIANGVKRVHLLIQSNGGSIPTGIALYNFLGALPIEVITHNIGGVHSVAVIVFLAGSVRRANSTSVFMVHKASITLQSCVGEDSLRGRIESMEIDNRNLETILKNNLGGMPQDKWIMHSKSDLFIPPEDAVKFGLIHEITDWVLPEGRIMACI